METLNLTLQGRIEKGSDVPAPASAGWMRSISLPTPKRRLLFFCQTLGALQLCRSGAGAGDFLGCGAALGKSTPLVLFEILGSGVGSLGQAPDPVAILRKFLLGTAGSDGEDIPLLVYFLVACWLPAFFTTMPMASCKQTDANWLYAKLRVCGSGAWPRRCMLKLC